jgi:hypothetical protein
VIAGTFFVGSALAGAAGVMFGLLFSQIFHLMGFTAGLKGFTAAVVGGIGSIPGAVLGGLLVGLDRELGQGLPQRQLGRPGRVRDPDRRDDRAAERPARDARRSRRSSGRDLPADPDVPPTPAATGQIGVDRWVSESGERREQPRRLLGRISDLWGQLPAAGKLALLTPAIVVPFRRGQQRQPLQLRLFILIYALLALGLNVVVGWAGLLDLGYVAFFGFGAYTYAFLSGRTTRRGTRSPTTGRRSTRS